MRQKIVRLTLVAGVLVLALLLLLATCGGGGGKDDGKAKKPVKKSTGPATRLPVPSAYTTQRGWELVGTSPDYAVSRTTGRLAYLVRAAGGQYRIRTIDADTGRAGWSGERWRPPAANHFPKLLTVTADDHEYFVTWAYGEIGENALTPPDTIVSLDVYSVEDGARQRVEVPWNTVPTVTATGPGILITDGRSNSVVVSPKTGRISKVPAQSLKYPKGCGSCKQLTEVRGLTSKGLLVSGAREFWVQNGWFSRNVAPKGSDRRSGIPTSVARGVVLAKWQLDKTSKSAATHDLWTVHNSETGRPLVSVECHKPAIEPGQYPQAVVSPSGSYLVAGNLAFDLSTRKGYCFENGAGAKALTLASVTDDGTAYGATSVRNAADVLAGAGFPVKVEVTAGTTDALSSNVRVPSAEGAEGVGLFRWTDEKERLHLIGYPRAESVPAD
ncbi:hypothetical protein P8A22_27870 [Streptomyces laculatispora]|uniref:Lipoprotein n=1 Tax=Streptomyces laculatispora TaxID=887464 RepID=A0ABY9I946_9ACTN|nr:hypothetical protein [Streptomyces laculatispora]WLQ43398.1 hypothetical protein P8A22_27870 [Streptomyces laculatispora]